VIYSSALIFATYLICSIILNYKIKLANNDNIKYYLKWQTIMLILIFLIFFVMIGMIGVTSSNSFVTILEEIKLPHNDFIKVSLWFNFIAIISTCVFILWLVILIILAAIFNPKRDDKKIGELYKEYLKNSSTI
jgi:amino acid transporter